MNKIYQGLGLAAMALAFTAAPAHADWGRGYRPAPPPQHYSHHHHRHHRHYQGGDAGWVAPLLFLGLAGAAISAAATPPPVTYVQPAPVVVAPPVTYAAPPVVVAPPPQAPAGTWYYCASASMYYPHTPYCPEGWQAVRPSPY